MPKDGPDLVRAAGWNEYWAPVQPGKGVSRLNPCARIMTNYVRRHAPIGTQSFAELGCSPGRWMIHANRSFGWSVAGYDYSETGIRLTRESLDAAGIEGTLYDVDLIQTPPEQLPGAGEFDVVLSDGLVEHFVDRVPILRAHLALLRPGGRAIISVPNLSGLQGAIMERAVPNLWQTHIRLTIEDLNDAGRLAGLALIRSGYVAGTNLYVFLDRIRTPWLRYPVYAVATAAGTLTYGVRSRGLASRVVAVFERPTAP